MSIKQDSQLVLEEMAQRCRDAYIHERRQRDLMFSSKTGYTKPHVRWDGGEDVKNEKVYEPIWPKIANFMIKHGLSPEHCIHIRFQQVMDVSSKPPYPNQIANMQYLEAYQTGYLEKLADSLQGMLQYEKTCCKTFISLAEEETPKRGKPLWRFVLVDESIPLSPLFRYCLARSEDIADVAENYEIPAMSQFMTAYDEYDKVWGAWIPTDFKERAHMVRKIASRASK